MPHQGLVAATISAISLVITMSLIIYVLRNEKKQQAGNTPDEH